MIRVLITIFEIILKCENPKIFCLGFTGIDSPYEAPLSPECVVKSGEDSIAACVTKVVKTLENKGILQASMTVPVKVSYHSSPMRSTREFMRSNHDLKILSNRSSLSQLMNWLPRKPKPLVSQN